MTVGASAAGMAPDLHRALTEILRATEHNPAAACRNARRLVLTWPDAVEARRVLAFALHKAKRTIEADEVDRETIELCGRQPALVTARAKLNSGELEGAEILLRDHLKRNPEDAAAAKMLADIAIQCGALREGEIFFRRAVLLAPGYQVARFALANLLSKLKREDDALTVLDEMLVREADHLGALSLKAGILAGLRRMAEADKTFRTLLANHPRNVLGWLNYGYLLKTINRIDDSIAAYRRALALNGATGLAWWGLANLKTVRFDATDVGTMRSALERSDILEDDRLHLCFALGKALNDLGDFEGAFASYENGNRIRRAQYPHAPQELTADVKKVERVLTASFFDARKRDGFPARDPIFIVSLPRSGSTLVEQILASHPLIEGTEELYDLERIALELGDRRSPSTYLDVIQTVSPAKLQSLGLEYIETTKRYRQTNKPFFTDKMPSNWKFVGIIKAILPNAKIIDVRRHPLGCGFANFTQHFNHGINFSYDMESIGRFYGDYVRQMSHFDTVFPGQIHRIFYEDLVENLEGQVRRMLDYLDLPFDQACMRFFDNKRYVHTPSAEQVRRPVNRDGMDTWRNYQQWLGLLEEALGPVLKQYPAVPAEWPV